MIHIRIEQKFKDYGGAFRQFDLDSSGSINFEEFVIGCERCGINLILDDFKLVFNLVDFNHSGEIDFKDFCLINTDKTNDVHLLIKNLKMKRQHEEEGTHQEIVEEKYKYLMNMK